MEALAGKNIEDALKSADTLMGTLKLVAASAKELAFQQCPRLKDSGLEGWKAPKECFGPDIVEARSSYVEEVLPVVYEVLVATHVTLCSFLNTADGGNSGGAVKLMDMNLGINLFQRHSYDELIQLFKRQPSLLLLSMFYEHIKLSEDFPTLETDAHVCDLLNGRRAGKVSPMYSDFNASDVRNILSGKDTLSHGKGLQFVLWICDCMESMIAGKT